MLCKAKTTSLTTTEDDDDATPVKKRERKDKESDDNESMAGSAASQLSNLSASAKQRASRVRKKYLEQQMKLQQQAEIDD